jgi:hypothetical protein
VGPESSQGVVVRRKISVPVGNRTLDAILKFPQFFGTLGKIYMSVIQMFIIIRVVLCTVLLKRS